MPRHPPNEPIQHGEPSPRDPIEEVERAVRRKRRLSVALSVCAVLLPLLVVFIGITLPIIVPQRLRRFVPDSIIGWIVLGSIVVALILLLIRAVVWRCPVCGRELGGGLGQRFCTNCGMALYDEYEDVDVCDKGDSQ